MTLASVFQRKKNAPPRPAGEAAGESADSLQWERIRARRRLIGAVLLLGVGVIAFPWLFETEPRPLLRDVPIDVARRDAGTVTVAPLPPAAAPATVAASRPASPLPPPDAGSEQAPPAPAPVSAQAPASAVSASAAAPKRAPSVVAARPAASAAAARPSASAVAPKAPAVAVTQAPRPSASQPLADAAAESTGRFVVQVGAFTDAVALRDARQRVEKLGLKTYTQVIETSAGKRTRVRVGPFATREEAEKAGAKLKAAGLPAYMLAL